MGTNVDIIELILLHVCVKLALNTYSKYYRPFDTLFGTSLLRSSSRKKITIRF